MEKRKGGITSGQRGRPEGQKGRFVAMQGLVWGGGGAPERAPLWPVGRADVVEGRLVVRLCFEPRAIG